MENESRLQKVVLLLRNLANLQVAVDHSHRPNGISEPEMYNSEVVCKTAGDKRTHGVASGKSVSSASK